MQNTKKDEWKNYTPKKRYPYALSAKKSKSRSYLNINSTLTLPPTYPQF
ncbi:hypothetical protein NBRC3257_3243 [Gluconobacter thailandicus NBRC 3257]|jgi:hypothetical protein|uniref:Uncharacterized protein n=1 Tax=Gluconobacter thailandicus NBRC 3257 TaxID=1381097 RepID=A0ABQ0J1C8_GLUTH|nr:hypothetical protein NBRC3257_3243 [Gluconobacter thailandicus NBRC 3257]